MKSFTDVSQSKKLAEILPLESADMYWDYDYSIYTGEYKYYPMVMDDRFDDVCIPCWSLAALLDVLPKKYYPIKDHETNLLLGKPKDKWYVLYWDATGMQDGEQTLEDNPIDACYEMIIKLHKEGLL